MDKAYVEVNLDILKDNTKEIINKYNDYKYYFGVVKSNAYGHGEYVVNTLVEAGINYIAVSYLDEALKVREYNKEVPILCFVPVDLDDLNTAIENNITITIANETYLDCLLNKLNKKVKVHIKLDTGMNRLGIKNKDEFDSVYFKLTNNKFITLEGIYTHLSTVGLHEKTYDNQIERFKYLTKDIDLNKIPIVHITSSANLVSHDKLEFTNGVRLGSILYGYNPTIRTSNKGIINKLRNLRNKYMQKKYHLSKVYTNVELNIKPCFKMYTHIMQIKAVKKDEYIGYGLSYKAKDNMKIAIIPVGYNNGIGFGINSHYVIINGNRYYVAGQVSMNMMAIIIDDNVNINDKVEIINEKLSPKTLASFTNKLTIEILLMTGKSNRKVYIKNNKIVKEIRP